MRHCHRNGKTRKYVYRNKVTGTKCTIWNWNWNSYNVRLATAQRIFYSRSGNLGVAWND